MTTRLRRPEVSDRYQIIRDGYSSAESKDASGARSGDIESEVKGGLAWRIALRTSRKGRVTIVESRWPNDDASGEFVKFIVKIDGTPVYRSSVQPSTAGKPEGAAAIADAPGFDQWLSGGAS
jgi:hypothetical protein